MQNSIASKILISRREFSTLTGLSLRTIAKLIASRELKSIRVGRRRLIPRAELDQFIKWDHRISVSSTVALRRRPAKGQARKAAKKRKARLNNKRRVNRKRKSPRDRSRVRHLKSRPAITDPRIARGLGVMRREGVSASVAAHREGMKLNTFRKGAGKFLYQPGPGKPWKARREDQLPFLMTILTSRGPVDEIVADSKERKLLHRYDLAVRMFRSAEDGAEAALKEFDGKTVAGHLLITDIDLLIQLEEADLIDAETFYAAIGARS